MKTRGITGLLFGLLLAAALTPLWAADTFDWTDVGERAFAVEVPNAGAVPGDAVHEWHALITLGPATPTPPQPQFLFIPPGSDGAVISLDHTGSYDAADASVLFRKNSPTEYELLVVYPPTGTEDIDRTGFPNNIRRWVVVVTHPTAAGGGSYGSATIAVGHREVLSLPGSLWLTGKVFLNDPPAPTITPSADPQVYNLAGAATSSVDEAGGYTDSLDQSWFLSRTYEYDWSPSGLSDVADPPAVSWGAGVYDVSLTVKELLKDRATAADVYQIATRQVTVVVKQPPAAALTVNPADEIISFDAAFDGTASSANAPAGAHTDLNYHWDYDGNGTEDGTTTDPIPPAYHFSTPGVYQPTLKVVDAYGLESALVSREVAARDRLGLPQAGWVPGAAPRPVIDGVLEGDNGWAGAYRRTYDMGAGNPPVAFRASKEQAESSSQPYLFLAFEVQSSTFDADDAVVLAFNPQRSGGVPALDRRLVFYPFASGPAGGTISPEVWKDSSAWSTDPGWSIDNLQAVSKANGTSWVLEMRIPTRAGAWGGAHWIDLANQFLFYFSVVEVDIGGTANATIYNWPKESEEISGNIDTFA
jgi:PKD repeat protein